jgi:pimeloyl-ACP methyl ester carboxylesterase
MKKVYFLSGLGADKRAFSFLDLSFCEPVFIEWIKPLEKESLKSYALRLRQQIPDEHPTVVGVSFGGMLATEMAKEDNLMTVIIIASNKSSAEFPAYLRVGKYLPVYKWLPEKLIKNKTVLSWVLGVEKGEQRKLIEAIVADTNPRFLKWAIDAILHWKETSIPGNVKHIHGTADKLLPYRLTKADHTIEGGTHIMTLYKHKEISDLLSKLIV